MSVAEYRVRTPPSYQLVVGALFGIATICAALFVMELDRRGAATETAELVVLLGIGCVLPFAYWIASASYRIGGGRNLIRIYDDRIEVPGVRSRQPMVFRREGLVLETRAVRVRLRGGAELNRGTLIELRSPTLSRSLSTLVLDDLGDAKPLLDDLQRFVAGNLALGRAGHDAKPRTEYDDRLDHELSRLE